MNKDQFARLERHRKVKQKLADWQTVVNAVPAFKKVANAYLGQLQSLDGTARKRPATSQGATQANAESSEALIARAVKAASALWLLYREEKDAEAAARLHRTPTDYRTMKDLERATEFLSVSQQLTTRIADLADYNLTAQDAATFAADAQAFDDTIERPQLAIDEQKIKGATARTTLTSLNRYLKEDFRAGLELIKDTHEEAYKELREASQVDDPAYRQRKAQRMVKRVDKSDARSKELRIYHALEGGSLSILKTYPPTLQIDALGETRTGGWSRFRLSAYIYKRPPADGIYDFDFLGTQPTGHTTDAITPCEAQERWRDYPTDLKGVRIHADGEDGRGQSVELML